ncbi:MAG: cytochrome c [Thermodesulfobacteriota bacterium]
MKFWFLIVGLILGFTTLATPAPVKEEARHLLVQKCSACHGVDRVYKEARPKAAWEIFIKAKQRLVQGRGDMEVSDAQAAVLVDYLTNYIGPEVQARRKSRARLFLIGVGGFLLILAIAIYIGVRQRVSRSATAGKD